jgi:hypothetical protein
VVSSLLGDHGTRVPPRPRVSEMPHTSRDLLMVVEQSTEAVPLSDVLRLDRRSDGGVVGGERGGRACNAAGWRILLGWVGSRRVEALWTSS